jgi:hypothetical protein
VQRVGEGVTTAERAIAAPGDIVKVESRTVRGVFYRVAIALDGTVLCNCPASYNHLQCWHIKHVKENLMTTETAVAIRPISLTTSALVPSKEDMERVNEAAAMVMNGRVTLPAELKNKQEVAALMLYGLELGLRPMTALRHLYIVNGKVNPSSEVMAGMLMRSDPDAKLIVDKLEVKGTGDGITGTCTMRIIRPSRGINQTYTVDWAEIKRAGLARENNLKYPEDRLRYHCTKRLLRIYAPDIINAFDDGPSFGSGVEVEGSPAIDETALYNDGDDVAEGEYRSVDAETGEINDGQPIESTKEQLDKIAKLFGDIKSSWGEASSDFKAMQAELVTTYGREKMGKLPTLTYEEAAAVLLFLRKKNGEPVEEPAAT